MEDVREHDRRLWIKEVLATSRIATTLLATLIVLSFLARVDAGIGKFAWGLVAVCALGFVHIRSAKSAAERHAFTHSKYQALWAACEDRLARFEDALKTMRRHRIAQFDEMPKTIREVGRSLYYALRRSDIVFEEVTKSEGWLVYHSPPLGSPPSSDAQAKELYRIADKNIAEYRQHYSAVMAGVQRTEAQAQVFTTTLDSLRMKMLGYRLTGRRPELSTQDFLESLTEAKMQLQAIDQALDELELSPFPTTISIMPPPMPSDVELRNPRS